MRHWRPLCGNRGQGALALPGPPSAPRARLSPHGSRARHKPVHVGHVCRAGERCASLGTTLCCTARVDKVGRACRWRRWSPASLEAPTARDADADAHKSTYARVASCRDNHISSCPLTGSRLRVFSACCPALGRPVVEPLAHDPRARVPVMRVRVSLNGKEGVLMLTVAQLARSPVLAALHDAASADEGDGSAAALSLRPSTLATWATAVGDEMTAGRGIAGRDDNDLGGAGGRGRLRWPAVARAPFVRQVRDA